ncbi:hypothetical protein NPIL_272531 [Nephila pilipes]|uniref:Uncharacterized protein n=1 Tax=Nephila pilipes TaxID=299642 RepID=A0A8X6UAC2_NEPPI|nr:hypothetical protein NPIL_272531 [Nephila pilipes]
MLSKHQLKNKMRNNRQSVAISCKVCISDISASISRRGLGSGDKASRVLRSLVDSIYYDLVKQVRFNG